jgi:putative N-acetyltransferase (TIGR04045 family)
VRRQVFCDEQHLFDCDDRDARDAKAESLHVIGTVDERIEGAVRLYPLEEPGLWKGDRLAVLPGSRVCHLGALLVRFAVRTAGDLGGERMLAHIQLGNVAFFTALGWRAEGAPVSFHGADHQLMTIGLRRSGR